MILDLMFSRCTMDMVLPRTVVEATSDSVCLPGEAVVKNKSLTIKNEHRKDKSEEKATSDMTFPLSVFSGFECAYIKQEDLEKAENESNMNEEPLLNMEVVSNETDPLLLRYSKAAATNQNQDVFPITWCEVQQMVIVITLSSSSVVTVSARLKRYFR